MTKVLGVDPGIHGALALISINNGAAPQLLDVLDVPVIGTGAKERVNTMLVWDWLKQHDPDHAPGAPERSRSRPLAPRDRTQPPQTPDTSTPTWEREREAVFESISSLRQLCETLSDQLAAIRWRQLGSVFDTPAAAFSEMKRWANAEAPLGQTRAGDATASQSATLNGDYTKPADGAT